ncbi:MAG: hydrogenase 4 subunit F [Candidatus Methanoplasma sp.]|nr:hydrogenase 4 subunit F [Candidatus Methanoplasma sp.]
MSLTVEIILAIPVATALVCAAIPWARTRSMVSIIGSLALLVASVPMCIDAFTGKTTEYSMWYVDGLSALFLILIALVGFMASIYSAGYIKLDKDEGRITSKDERIYSVLFHTFVAVMLTVCVVSSFGIMWIAIEATTLVSAFLVGFYRKESSTEAAWKYLMICSVGITLALMGIILIYASSMAVLGNDPGALNWPILYSVASDLDPSLLKIAFVFVLVGFGTKMGLVPMHTWLPDAHSQSPTPISAMLSAVLLNCAMYTILRFQMILNVAVPGFSSSLMIGFGLISMAVAAAFILISKDIKRMLAYSTIEHMGIMMIGFGIGTPLAVFGALFHVIAHSLTKTFVFFAAGNVIQGYGTSNMADIKGLREKMPFTAFMMTAGTLAILGVPPFAVFIGEISILAGAFSDGMYIVAAVMVVLIIVVFAGFLRNVLPMLSGDTKKEVKDLKGISRALPMVLLLLAIILLGLFMPEQMRDALESIADAVTGGIL